MSDKYRDVEINWKPDKDLKIPVYKQIIEYIKKSEKWGLGSRAKASFSKKIIRNF